MDSKMRPLYLVFENLDELGDLVRIIFKNGDGECDIIWLTGWNVIEEVYMKSCS